MGTGRIGRYTKSAPPRLMGKNSTADIPMAKTKVLGHGTLWFQQTLDWPD